MVKTSLLYQIFLVTCCVSLVAVSAMPQRSGKSNDDDDSDESCEGNHCSNKGSRNRDSTTKKPSSDASRSRRPSSIDAAPVKQQDTSITSIKTSSGLVDTVDPSTGGAACTTCLGDNPAMDSATGTVNQMGDASVDPLTGEPCTTCAGANTAAGTVGTTGTTGKIPFRKPSLGEAGRIRNPGSVSVADASTGAACTTCTGTATATGTTTGTTVKTGGADPSTGATCTTCTGVDKAVDQAIGTAAGTVGTTGTTPIRKPSLVESGRIRNPGSANVADPASTGAACTTCTAATGTAIGAVGSTGATGKISIGKPILGEAGRIRNPGSVNQSDPSATGAPCTTCTSTTGTAGKTETTVKIGGASTDPSATGAACITCKATGTATGTADTTGKTVQTGGASTGAACTTCAGVSPAKGTTGTISATEATATGTAPVRKPIFGESGRIRTPGSATSADPASTGTACTTCTSTGTVGATGKTPIKKPGLTESGRIRNPGDPSVTGAPCTTCTSADPATAAKESSVVVTTPAKKTINLIDPARIRRPATQATGSSTKQGSVGSTCTTCIGGSSVAEPSAVSDVVKKEADPSLIETFEETVVTDSESDPSTEAKTLSRFNTTVVKTVEHIHFNYDDPNRWKEHNSLCKGAHQSPINIETRKTIVSPYPDISFFNYDQSFPENLENNGHTVQLSIDKLIPADSLPFITGGGLDGLYQFAQLHFHWGEGLQGSEHTIDGKHYVAEAHIVHWDMKYGSFVNATKHNDGLHVLGILIELQARDNIAFRHLEQFGKLSEAGCAKTDQLSYSVPLSDLLPDSTSSFYRYAGSLTDARCNEDVIWTVFDTPIAISERQLAKFRLLTDEHGKLLTKNVRPTQLSHKRTVIYNPPSAPVV